MTEANKMSFEGPAEWDADSYDDFLTIYRSSADKDGLHVFCKTCPRIVRPVDLAIRVIDTLLTVGHRIDAKDRHGRTALWHAVDHRNEAIIPHLLKRGANMRVSDNYGTSLLQYAANVHNSMVKLFMLYGAKLEEFGPYPANIPSEITDFYASILRTRRASTILLGARQKCPLLKSVGKDCCHILARMLYALRGTK